MNLQVGEWGAIFARSGRGINQRGEVAAEVAAASLFKRRTSGESQ